MLGLVATRADGQIIIADYPMNEASWSGPGPQVIDSTGNGHNGTAMGGATTISDPAFGQVGSFDGSDQYVIVSGSYPMSGARSITAWVDPVSNQNSLGMPIVTGGVSGEGDLFGISGAGGEGYSLPQYELYVDHWGGRTGQYHSTSSVTPGTWNQVVMTYDGSGTSDFYINGEPAGYAMGDYGNLYNYDFSTYVIGGNTIGGSTTQASFDGLMRDVEFYNYALSAAQVASLYRQESPSTPVPTWRATGSGSWSNSGNWTNGVPNDVGVGATFNVPTSAVVTVTLDTPVTLGSLQFGNSGSTNVSYKLSGSGSNSLTLNNSGSVATITVIDGTHAINAPVILADNLTATTGGTNSWTFRFGTASSITDNGAGYSLTMSGTGGTLILSGSDSYTGGTFVTAGTLEATTAAALPEGSSLTIGAGGTFIFDPTATAAPLVASPAGLVAPVPEPGTLVLLLAGAMLAAFAAWRQRKNWGNRL